MTTSTNVVQKAGLCPSPTPRRPVESLRRRERDGYSNVGAGVDRLRRITPEHGTARAHGECGAGLLVDPHAAEVARGARDFDAPPPSEVARDDAVPSDDGDVVFR